MASSRDAVSVARIRLRDLPRPVREKIQEAAHHRRMKIIATVAAPLAVVGSAGYYLLEKPLIAIPMAAYAAVATYIGLRSRRKARRAAMQVAEKLGTGEQSKKITAAMQGATHIGI